MAGAGIAAEGFQIRFDIDLAHAVQGYEVKIPDALIIFRRIAGGGDDPAFRNRLIAESLALQELQHGRRQRLGDTVDFIDKKNTFFLTCLLHVAVNAADDFAHGVFGDGSGDAVKYLFLNEREAHSALSRMVGNGIGDETDAAFLRNLLHDLCFSDAGRPHQKDGTLPDLRNTVLAVFILVQISPDSIFDIFFCFLYIHGYQSFKLIFYKCIIFPAHPHPDGCAWPRAEPPGCRRQMRSAAGNFPLLRRTPKHFLHVRAYR